MITSTMASQALVTSSVSIAVKRSAAVGGTGKPYHPGEAESW